MHPHTSPRLPGVPILKANATGPEYSRWRRSVKFALETKDMWKYCDGTKKMPMPDARPQSSALIPINQKTKHIQPSLLEERRAWVRQDREVKLDVFLSLAEEVMQDIFEVGPPLPPSNLNAQAMLEALDERFDVFDFEAYHHAFCHFLNLHIDQYTSIAEFNKEFTTVLEDLLDYDHPLSNTQACSAYFSKLRCTQNPWVAKRLKEWNAQTSEPEIHDLVRESPPWSCIRPLTTKPSQIFPAETTPDEHLEDSSGQSESDAAPELSDSTDSSVSHSRQISSSTKHSQEITVHASTEDITILNPHALREALENIPSEPSPERLSPNAYTPTLTESATPAWLSAKEPASFLDRPLPPLPSQSHQNPDTESRARSASPRLPIALFRKASQTSLTVPPTSVRPRTADPTFSPVTPLRLETVHPVLRPRTSTSPPLLSDHPAFRNASPSSEYSASETLSRPRPSTAIPPIKSSIAPFRTVFPALESPVYSSSPPKLVAPSSTPELRSQWSDSTRTTLLSPKLTYKHLYPVPVRQDSVKSSTSSVISLPLQGTRDSAWEYLDSGREHSVSPIQPSLSRDFQVNDYEGVTALPVFEFERTPTFDDFVLPPKPASTALPSSLPTAPSLMSKMAKHRKSTSLDFGTRLSGESLLESSEETKEKKKREKEKERKGKGWSIGVNIARFTHSKGVREMI